jgi:hypothetical protein
MTPRRTFLKHSRRASSTISYSQPAELEFPATRSKHCHLAFSRSQLFREISTAHSHSINASPRYPSPTCSSPADNKINRQLARMEFAVSHSKQTTARRINRQLSPVPSTPFFSLALCGPNRKRNIRTHCNSVKTNHRPEHSSRNKFTLVCRPARRTTTHQSPITSFTTPSVELLSLPTPPLCYSHRVTRVPPMGLHATAPARDPWQAGAFPYSQPEERVLCTF